MYVSMFILMIDSSFFVYYWHVFREGCVNEVTGQTFIFMELMYNFIIQFSS